MLIVQWEKNLQVDTNHISTAVGLSKQKNNFKMYRLAERCNDADHVMIDPKDDFKCAECSKQYEERDCNEWLECPICKQWYHDEECFICAFFVQGRCQATQSQLIQIYILGRRLQTTQH